MKSSIWTVVMVVVSLGLNSTTWAQDKCPTGFMELIEKPLPAEVGNPGLMAEFLAAKVGPQLSESFDPAQAMQVVDDRLSMDMKNCEGMSPDGESGPRCTYRNETGSIMRVVLGDRGKIAYLNPTRRFDAAGQQANQMEQAEAIDLTLKTSLAFGISRDEINQQQPVVRELMVAGRDAKNAEPPEIRRAEIHVRLARLINRLPVFDSESKIALDARGQIARLQIQWPDFRMAEGLSAQSTLPREAVSSYVNRELSQGSLCNSLSKVESFIAYVKTKEVTLSGEGRDSDDRGPSSGYVPALVVYATPVDPKEDSGELAMAGQQFVAPLLGQVER